MEISLDKVRGMLAGVFLGDALGAPHEFRCNSSIPYTGILEHEPFYISQYGGKRTSPVATITDDSEMTLALLRSLIANNGYNRDSVLSSYLSWANSDQWMMGKNTRSLLKGVTTKRGYQNRVAKLHSVPENEISQSNGSLMRCSPLSLLFNNDIVIADCSLTNPNSVSYDTNLVYINFLRLLLQGGDRKDAIELALSISQTEETREAITQASEKIPRDISTNKGWCVHGLFCALSTIHFDNFEDCMEWIITQKGSDTDTNAAIAGAAIGAYLGFESMMKEEITRNNFEKLILTNSNGRIDSDGGTEISEESSRGLIDSDDRIEIKEESRIEGRRPESYQLGDFYQLTEKAWLLTRR